MKNTKDVEELLVVIDVVNGFINEGAMMDSYIARIIPGIEDLVKEYIKKDNTDVFYIRDCHKEDASEFTKFPVHCLENTSESEMVNELLPYQDKVRTFKKNSTSAIFAEGLMPTIKEMKNLKRVVVVGCCSDICVLNFALPLICYFDENNALVDVEIREDLIETYDAPNHNRDEYNEITKKLLTMAGAKITKGKVNTNGRK